MPVLAWFIVGVLTLVVGLILFVVLIRWLSTSKHVVFTTRADLVRAQARADAAERNASAANARQMHAARLASNAVAVTGQALDVARRIDKVSRQMDALIGYVTDDPADLAIRGRHAVPGDPDLEREFLS